MLIKATQKYTRQTPRKVRLVANTVRKMPLEKALQQLAVIEKKATMVVTKTVQQAIANATHNHGYQLSDLSLDNILITEGPRYRRFRSVSRGRAHGIIKRTCHVTVILKTKDEASVKPAAAEKTAPAQIEAKTEVKAKTEKKTAKPAAKSVKKVK
jgi:large subunit ribosomal protein L22